jgi:nicotinate phosphoribosyltransferase
MITMTHGRADASVFNLPVDRIRSGYYSDQYFNYTKGVLEAMPAAERPTVVMQVFQKNEAILGGIDEAIAIVRECSGATVTPGTVYCNGCLNTHPFGVHDNGSNLSDADKTCLDADAQWENGWDQLTVEALREGDTIAPYEPVMRITGPYHLFAHLETVYLGTLARRTLIGTNVREVLDAANGKPILYFPARHDHWSVQTGDGYAAYIAGVEGVSTDAQANWWGGKGMGTVPHGLIAAFGGNTVQAAIAFHDRYGDTTNVSVLVDFDNDCAETALAVATAFKRTGRTLWGVRLDTSESLVDRGLMNKLGQFKPTGVNPELVRHVRQVLDYHGHQDVKIIVSGGFKADKIREFERLGVPVDAYGVGSSLIRGANDFTADVVRILNDGKWADCAKVGREYTPSNRLEVVS